MESSERFVEYVENSISNRNQIIPINIYHKATSNTAFMDKESYSSYYSFDISLYEYVQKNSSVKGYEGLVYVNRLILDVDKGALDDYELFESFKANIAELLEFGVKTEDINIC